MNDQLQKVLSELASKLGTSVEYLWRVLIAQTKVEALIDFIWVIIPLVVGIGLYKLHNKFLKEDGYDDLGGLGSVMIVLFFAWVGLAIFGLYCVSDMISALLNPEYWALKQIVGK